MQTPLEQHQIEIERNRKSWEAKPLLRQIYAGFYHEIMARIDPALPGEIVELGSGIGNLKSHLPAAICTDLFPNPWLDLACDAYHLPFRPGSISHLILFDVFHHLERPFAFLHEASRVLRADGKVILFEPFISLASWFAYGLFHHEPVAWSRAISAETIPPPNQQYYAAQGNATRLFFRKNAPALPAGWSLRESRAIASFAYLCSGGLSKRSLYPPQLFETIKQCDALLSRFPNLFGARALVVLERQTGSPSARS